MAKKKTGKKAAPAAPQDRPSGQSDQPPASVAPVSSQAKTAPVSVSPAPRETRESRPPAPSSVVPAEPPPVVKVTNPESGRIEAAPAVRVEPAPPKEPASTAPVVKDIDEDGEPDDREAAKAEAPKPAPIVPTPAEEKKASEPRIEAKEAAKTPEPAAEKSKDADADKEAPASATQSEPEETAPVSARGSGSTEDTAPPSKADAAPASALPTSNRDDDAPPSSRAPDSSAEDKISGKALLDERLAPKSTGKKKKKAKDGAKAKSEIRESEPPDSPRGVTLDAHDDGHDDFFTQADEKVRQKHYVADVHDSFDDDEPRFRPLTADDVVRRNKLRRIVTIVVGTAAAACLLAGVRLSMGTKHADPPPLDRSQVVIAAPPVPKPQLVIEEPKPAASPAETATAPAPSGSAAAASSASAAASASAAPATSAPSGPADPEEAKKLAKNALRALESGNNKVAVERSSAAVDADPSDATGYLYWGTALMNMGKLGDAKKVFASCVEKATKGPKGDCKQFRLARLARLFAAASRPYARAVQRRTAPR